jgi:hypothetical protein
MRNGGNRMTGVGTQQPPIQPDPPQSKSVQVSPASNPTQPPTQPQDKLASIISIQGRRDHRGQITKSFP